METKDESNQSKNLQTKTPDSQGKPKQTLEAAAIGFLKAKAWVKKKKGLVISITKMIVQIKGVEFKAFIEEANESGGTIRIDQLDNAADSGLIDKTELQNYKLEREKGLEVSIKEWQALIKDEKFKVFFEDNGEFRLEHLDKAVEAGLIEKNDLELYKKHFENGNRKRIESEREWADEEARIEAERESQGGSKEVPPSEKPGSGKEKAEAIKENFNSDIVAIIKAAKKKGVEQKAKELQQDKPKQDMESSSMDN